MAGKKVTKPLYTQEESNQLYESAMTNYLNEKVYGVVPHDLMHMNLNLAPLAAAGAGAAAMVGRAGNNLYKKLTTKAGAKKVYREIERLGAYIMKGEYAEKYKIQIRLRDGGKKNTIKSYDQIVDRFKETIKDDIKKYLISPIETKNGEQERQNTKSNNLQVKNVDSATIYFLIKKYDTLFKELGKDFPDLNKNTTASTKDIDIAEQIKEVCEHNLQYADQYINKLIELFEKKFTIKGIINKEKEGNADRVQKWSMILKAAWENVKKDIREYYSGLPKDIAKTVEFVALYKLVDKLYKKIPSINSDVDAIKARIEKELNNSITTGCMFDVQWYKSKTDVYQAICIAKDERQPDNALLLQAVREIDIDDIITKFNKDYKTNYQCTDIKFYFFRAIGDPTNKRRKTELFKESDTDRALYLKYINVNDSDLKQLNNKLIDANWMAGHCGISIICKITNRNNYSGQSATVKAGAFIQKWNYVENSVKLPTQSAQPTTNGNDDNKSADSSTGTQNGNGTNPTAAK